MRASDDPITALRAAIDTLPVRTRVAMLEGIRSEPIIAGAYTDSRGGICPMLAAHRHGGRTTLLAFARSWDRFTRASRARHATHRELAILERHLEASLFGEQFVDLKAAIAEHQSLVREHAAEKPASRPEAAEIEARRLKPVSGVRRLRPGRRTTERDAARALERLERELTRA